MVIVAWVDQQGRNDALAAELQGEVWYVVWGDRGVNAAMALVRYVVQTARTVAKLLRHRPKRVIVMLPPFPALVVCWVYAKLRRARLVADAHSGVIESSRWTRFLPATAWLLRRADGAVVTNPSNAASLEELGVHTVQVNDTPEVADHRPPPAPGRPTVLIPASFAEDEPIGELVAAVRSVPEVDVVITGRDYEGRVDEAGGAPPNLSTPGFVPWATFEEYLHGATAVCCLTTLDHCMQRGGYEALGLAKPLVTSDTPVLRDYFGDAAVFTPPEADAIAAAIRRAVDERDDLHQRMLRLGDAKLAGREAELAPLRALLDLPT